MNLYVGSQGDGYFHFVQCRYYSRRVILALARGCKDLQGGSLYRPGVRRENVAVRVSRRYCWPTAATAFSGLARPCTLMGELVASNTCENCHNGEHVASSFESNGGNSISGGEIFADALHPVELPACAAAKFLSMLFFGDGAVYPMATS